MAKFSQVGKRVLTLPRNAINSFTYFTIGVAINPMSRLPLDWTERFVAADCAACAPVLLTGVALLPVGMLGSPFIAVGTMYEVAFEAARRKVERDAILERASRLN